MLNALNTDAHNRDTLIIHNASPEQCQNRTITLPRVKPQISLSQSHICSLIRVVWESEWVGAHVCVSQREVVNSPHNSTFCWVKDPTDSSNIYDIIYQSVRLTVVALAQQDDQWDFSHTENWQVIVLLRGAFPKSIVRQNW